ncbi:MAG: hypothetical protein E6K85_09855 [Thaumarchaeota archaeon]|nr:MAG: hypothetical protein E6K85_09855 [Nitrososphaerota archaeon]
MKVRFIIALAVVIATASTLGIISWVFLSTPGMQQVTAEMYANQGSTSTATSSNHPVTRTLYLFNAELDQVNKTKVGFTGDVYSLKTIVANKGDKVVINFFNTEPTADERHSFTLPEYSINRIVNGGDHATISFVANKSGIFEYHCIFHPPEMRGQLIVLQGQGQEANQGQQ